MNFSETDEATLAKIVMENMGKPVDDRRIKIDGAQKAAELILQLEC